MTGYGTFPRDLFGCSVENRLVGGRVGRGAEAGPSFKRQNPIRKDASLVKSDNAGSSEK